MEKLFNDATSFKKKHSDYNDLDLFFEFDTINKLDTYPKHAWEFILKRVIKIFSCDEDGLCSIILYDLLESQKITRDAWKRVFSALQQARESKRNIKG